MLAAAGLSAWPARAASSKVRLGGPVFLRSDDPAELAKEHRRLGYSAAYCPNVALGDTARQQAIEKAFAAENVVIAEVGAWKNMLDPDSGGAQAESGLRRRALRYCRCRGRALLRRYRGLL